MTLPTLIERYLALRQSLGAQCRDIALILRAFGRAIGPRVNMAAVRPQQVSKFLAGTGPVTRTWHKKYSVLLGFYRFAISRGYLTTSPLPVVLAQKPAAFVAYIYTVDELRRLLHAADSFQHRRCCLEPITLRTVVLLLYGAGLRVGEAIRLDRRDVDFDNAVLTVRRTKFHKSRLVPFGLQLGHALVQYASRPSARDSSSGSEDPFFTTRQGCHIKSNTLYYGFRRICELAGIRRSDNAKYRPRLHDLRHSFAVNRLTSWYRQGADVQRLLPQLSVYLGHAKLSGTQVYLSMTPELLQEANIRFARYAEQESHHD
jgi:integrase/recombinase XerD